MTSTTETVIRAQFPYWTAALGQALPALPAGRPLVLTGCGSSFYLSQALAAVFNAAGRQAVAVPGAEWAGRPGAYVAGTGAPAVIGLSRSGTTSETVEAIRASREKGWPTLALSCEPGSTILAAAETGLYLPTHPAEGVVMSVSASLMLLAGLRLAGAGLDGVVAAAERGLAAMDGGARAVLAGRSHFVFLGGGALYGIACEGALKLQEMSISYAQAFHPLEYRHGPISLMDENSLAVMLYSEAAAAEAKVVRDMQSKGAKVIGIGGPGDLRIDTGASGPAAALAALPALQILGEHLAVSKGIDTEHPRNLTKVVVLD